MVRRAVTLLLAVGFLLAAPAVASAATVHVPLVSAGILGSIFGTIGHAVLGAFSWTVGLASKFLLTTLAGLVKLLIPRSWINDGLSIMEWIVAVPDYAGTIATPGGGHEFGFAGINALRELFMWLGLAVAPLSLTYATSRAMVGFYDPVAAPVMRVVGASVLVASYGYLWGQAAALADQITHAILTLPDVARGLDQLMAYAVGGVALGGWQLIDLALMAAIGIELLALIFLKVVLILAGALLYATGPLMVGLVATRVGYVFARAWASAVTLLFILGIGWATLFAVGALLINDSTTAGPLLAGNGTFGSLLGGLLLAVAGLASLWLCLKAAREAAGLLRAQLAGLLAVGRGQSSGTGTATSTRVGTSARSLRDYGARLAGAAAAAGGELAAAVPGGGSFATAGRAVGQVGRRGLVGTAGSAVRGGAGRAATATSARGSGTRVGAVAVRMARSGRDKWNNAGGQTTQGRAGSKPTRGSQSKPRQGRPTSGATGGPQQATSGRSGGSQRSTSGRGPTRAEGRQPNGPQPKASSRDGRARQPTSPVAPRPVSPGAPSRGTGAPAVPPATRARSRPSRTSPTSRPPRFVYQTPKPAKSRRLRVPRGDKS